jgi:sigma-B regulation protein RsbU (phosphoserine phosphatase)
MLDLRYTIIIITILYLAFLLLIAHLSEKVYSKNKNILNNPYIYTLTLAAYCSTWTFYGSVDRAATSGIDYLTIYIGPTLIIFTWWFLLRKVIVISERHNINSIAGFLSFRYGKSKSIGALVTILCFISVIPYISLQLKAISDSISIIIRQSYNIPTSVFGDISFTLTILLSIVTAIFAIYLNIENRKHPGLIGVVAFQSFCVLIIILIVGSIITYKHYDGFASIFNLALNSEDLDIREHIRRITSLPVYDGVSFDWFSINMMSMLAILLLPRMFHMAVVENLSEKNLSKSIYLFPFYLFLINLFVYPIAISGILNNTEYNFKSYFMFIPLMKNNMNTLTLLVYLGGLASGLSMILVSSITLANMAVNYIIIPLLIKFFLIRKKKLIILNLRRICIFGILILAYLYYYFLGNTLRLRDMGLISFSAIVQFAPAFIFGLYWKNANAKGAAYGIICGFVVWAYTVIIPYMANIGILDNKIVLEGPYSIELLKPTALFGIENLGSWGHAFFWSLLTNIFVNSLFSLFTKQSDIELETSNICVKSLDISEIIETTRTPIDLTITDLQNILANFFGENFANEKIEELLKSIDKDKSMITSLDIISLKNAVEKTLSEAVGPSASKLIIDTYVDIRGIKERKFINVFRDLLSLGIGESKDTLIKRISELNVMLKISNIFSDIGNLQIKAYKVLNLIKNTFKIDAVILREKRGDKLIVISFVGDSKDSYIMGFDRELDDDSYVGKCVFDKRQLAVNDIDEAKLNDYSIELKNSGVLSFCHTPLIVNNEVVGVLSVFSKLYKGLFTDDFLVILQSISNQIAFYINNIKQTEELIRMREISKELEIAKNIQKSLLPYKYPDINGVDISAVCLPSEYVGGDYYDFFITNNGCLDIIIADVSGHDVAAALIMSEVRTLIKTIISYRPNAKPSEIVTLLNNIIYNDLERMEYIITLLYMRFNFKTKEVLYSNAGHTRPTLYRIDNISEIREGDILIGALKDYKYNDYMLPLFKDDIFLLYTDGVTESENEMGDFFGEEKLLNCVKQYHEEHCKNILDSILNEIIKFRGLQKQKDDITMVVLKIKDI